MIRDSLSVFLAAIPLVVIPGVLSTFEPVKAILTGALAILAVTYVAASRIVAGTFSLSTIADTFGNVATIRGVRRAAVWSLVAVAALTFVGSIASVSPDTSWFGTLGRGQGTLFLVAVGAMVAVNTSSVTTVAGVGTLLRALAVGSLPVAVATILQRFGLDPVSGTPCDVERLQTTIGNALPGSTYLGLATLVSLEHLRHAWASWWAPSRSVAVSQEAVTVAPTEDSATSVAVRTDPTGGRRRSRRAGAEARSVAPVAAADTATTSSDADASAWIGPAALVVGACAAVFAALAITRGDFGRTWVAIPVALVWGAAVARATSRGVRVPPAVAVAGWSSLIVLLAIANGLTLSRGPQLAFVVGAGLWVVSVATARAGRLDMRAGGWAVGAVIVTGVAIGVGWFVPTVGCAPAGTSAAVAVGAPSAPTEPGLTSKPTDAATAISDATDATPSSLESPGTSDASAVSGLSSAMATALDRLSSRVNFLTDTRAGASVGWRTNVWVHTLDIYLDRPPSVEAKARAMSAALAGAQYGDVVALNGAPGSRAPGGWWYRLMGYGPDSQVFTLATSTSADIRAVQGDITYDRAHNVVLDVLITTGAIGLVAWAINLGAAFVLAWRLRRRGGPGVATAALAPILACIFVSGLSGVDATTITLINWIVIAIAIGLPAEEAPTPRRLDGAPPTRRASGATPLALPPASEDLPRLVVVGAVIVVGCVAASLAGVGATVPAVWGLGAFVGMVVVGLALADRPFRRGRPDARAIVVTMIAAVVATVVMTPAWNALAAGHYARLTQDAALPKDRLQAYAKRAVALDPGQATYRVLAGG